MYTNTDAMSNWDSIDPEISLRYCKDDVEVVLVTHTRYKSIHAGYHGNTYIRQGGCLVSGKDRREVIERMTYSDVQDKTTLKSYLRLVAEEHLDEFDLKRLRVRV